MISVFRSNMFQTMALAMIASLNCLATFPSASSANITILEAGPAVVTPGAPMHFVIRLENTGTVAWNPVYTSASCLAFVNDMQNCIFGAGYVPGMYYLYAVAFKMDSANPFNTFLGGNALVPLPGPVQPGETVELRTTIAAPMAPGRYSFAPWMGQGYYNFTSVGLTSGEEGYNFAPKFPFIVATDAEPPSLLLKGMIAGNCSIWPPNGKMVTVGSVSATDSGSGLSSLDVSVTSNDPATLPSDIVVTTSDGQQKTIRLAAKRSGGLQEGRIYTIDILAKDQAGNSFRSNRKCTVDHDQSNN